MPGRQGRTVRYIERPEAKSTGIQRCDQRLLDYQAPARDVDQWQAAFGPRQNPHAESRRTLRHRLLYGAEPGQASVRPSSVPHLFHGGLPGIRSSFLSWSSKAQMVLIGAAHLASYDELPLILLDAPCHRPCCAIPQCRVLA